ncbi:MAG: M23 family metallopeptidase [Leptospiraceae bacterium]|nr:M23 family metallopeptidase [Leptospiraceae bacterium]
MDFATGGKIGTPILAISDGEVIRVLTNRYSIGNAIFVKHRDGFISKYGHLSAYSPKVKAKLPGVVKTFIERRVDYDFTLIETIPVKKGEVIAYAGNTGIGPIHLHLEIMKDGIYYNPALFGINYNPNSEIVVYRLSIKPEGSKSRVNGSKQELILDLSRKSNGVFLPASNKKIIIEGKASVSIWGHERSGSSAKIGFQGMELFANGKMLQQLTFHRIKSSHKYRSGLPMDNYRSSISGKPFKYYLHSRVEHGLLGYKYPQKGKGLLVEDELARGQNRIEVMVSGLQKEALVSFDVYRNAKKRIYTDKKPTYNVFPHKPKTIYSEDKRAKAHFPSYSVFFPDNYKLYKTSSIHISAPGMKALSNFYTITPYCREFNLGFDLILKLPKNIKSDKAGLYRINAGGNSISFYDSEYIKKGNFYKRERLRTAGTYAILEDNEKPIIEMYRYKSGINFKKNWFKLYLKVKDKGSGVRHMGLKVWVDGKETWVDYDPEGGLREVFRPRSLIYGKGNHVLTAVAIDRAGNKSDPFTFHYTVE